MGIFSKKTAAPKKAKSPKVAAKKSERKPRPMDARLSRVIVGPRVTEKAAHLAGANAYTFNVAKDATKREIAQAIQAIYGVVPQKVTTAAISTKPIVRAGRYGDTKPGKKAVVFLAKGETIQFV
jgi:large subunit ribosomal protein L23